MIKKQNWMIKGAKVLALGKEGTVTKMQENIIGNPFDIFTFFETKGIKGSIYFEKIEDPSIEHDSYNALVGAKALKECFFEVESYDN